MYRAYSGFRKSFASSATHVSTLSHILSDFYTRPAVLHPSFFAYKVQKPFRWQGKRVHYLQRTVVERKMHKGEYTPIFLCASKILGRNRIGISNNAEFRFLGIAPLASFRQSRDTTCRGRSRPNIEIQESVPG